MVQYDPVWENKEASQKKITALMPRLDSDVSLIIFPELTLTGFTMRSKKFAEELDGKSIDFFSQLANKYSTHVIAGFIESESHQFFNIVIWKEYTYHFINMILIDICINKVAIYVGTNKIGTLFLFEYVINDGFTVKRRCFT